MATLGARLSLALTKEADPFWRTAFYGGLIAFCACFLPGIEVEIEGDPGPAPSIQLHRQLTLATEILPYSLMYVAGAAALVLLAYQAMVTRRPDWWVIGVFLISAPALVHLASLSDDYDSDPQLLPASSAHGCHIRQNRPLVTNSEPGYPDVGALQCGGAFLSPALDDFLADEKRDHPTFTYFHGYNLRPLIGWWLIQPISLVLALWSAFRILRLKISDPERVIFILAGVVALVYFIFFLNGLEQLG
jgi:hypothetical protein